MDMIDIELSRLHAHPKNSNVMPEPLLAKLVEHLRTTDRYPPLIVRTFGQDYQILDGHHRAEALRRLDATTAHCVVWDVDDDEALLLLATLNRLQGSDDPRKRGELVRMLSKDRSLGALQNLLPERREQLQKLMDVAAKLPSPRVPRSLQDQPVSVQFFLLPDERARVEAKLREVGPTREAALVELVCGQEVATCDPS